MRSTLSPVLLTLIALAIFLPGCQDSPVMPENSQNQGLSDSTQAVSGAGHQCLGYYQVVFDTENDSIEIVQLKSTDLHLNVVNFLNASMGISIAGVPSEHDPPTGLFVFDITLTHPFAMKTQFAGFDVKGILMTPGTLTIGPLTLADLDETRLENADGYTRWWNPTEFTGGGVFGYSDGIYANASASQLTSTLNPFKVFADILDATDHLGILINEPLDTPEGRAVFTAGSENTRRYRIRFPMTPGPQIVFGYAVDASWAMPSPNPPAEIPDDFPIQANQPEAFNVGVEQVINTLYYDTETGTGGGVLRLQLDVNDWQGIDSGDIDGEVESIRIFSPDLMGGGVSGEFLSETFTTGYYTADLFGEAVPSSTDDALVAVKVKCSGAPPYGQGIHVAPSGTVSAWNVISVGITDPECSADSNNDFANSESIDFGGRADGVVCPVTDVSDYYNFSIPIGNEVSGEIRVYSDAGPTTVTLYDESYAVLVDETISDLSVISLDGRPLLPGTYYISIESGPSGDLRPYLLELDGELTDVSPCDAVDVTPTDLFVEAYHVFMEGNFAFLVGYEGIWVYDVSNPANPVNVAYVETLGAEYADFYYPYCYGLKYGGGSGEKQLDMVDFSDPYNPIVHEDIFHYTESVGPAICMDEQYLYIGQAGDPDYEIQIFDYIANPLSPSLITTIDTDIQLFELTITEIPTYGKYLVVGSYEEVWAYSIENLSGILEVPPYAFPGSTMVTNIACDAETIYVTHRDGGYNAWLYTLQLDSFGTSLVYYDNMPLDTHPYSIFLDDTYLYLGDSYYGLTVFDISTPTNPVLDNTNVTIAATISMDMSGEILCTSQNQAGMVIFDMTDPTSPIQYTELWVADAPQDIAAIGDYLFVSDSAVDGGAIFTLDISDPSNAVFVAKYITPGEPRHLSASGNNLLVGCYGGPFYGWVLLDASDPVNLLEIMSEAVADSIDSVLLTPGAVYVSTSFPEVLVYDYSVDPPVNMGGMMVARSPQTMTYGLNHIYLTNSYDVEILSVTSPLSPGYEGIYIPVDEADDCEVAGEYLYIAGDSTLEVASLADPSNPVFLTSLEVTTSYDLTEITIDGQYVFVTSYECPLYAIQRLPVDAPTIACTIRESTDFSSEALLSHQGFLYDMQHYEGLRIWEQY